MASGTNIKASGNTVNEILMYNQGMLEFRRKKRSCNRITEPCREQFERTNIMFRKMRDELTINEEHYLELERNFSAIPATNTNLLLKNMDAYCIVLKDLIKTFKETSDELDNISMVAESVSLLSSLLSLAKNINSLFNNEVSNSMTSQAYDTNPVLGVVSQLFWNCVPQSICIRFLTSIGQKMATWWVLRKLLKTINMCEESWKEVEEFFTKSKEINEKVESDYFCHWDSKLVNCVEKTLSDHSASAKIFATLYVSAIICTPLMLQRFDFLRKIFIFSTSAVGEEWYRRNLIQDLFSKIIIKTGKIDVIDMKELSKSSKFMDLAMLPETAVNILESGSKTIVKDRVQVKTKSATPFVFGALDCIFIYFSYKELMYGVKNKNSALFRNLASGEELRLRKINSYMQYISRF